MPMRISPRFAILATLYFCVSSAAFADPVKVTWDAARATSPDSVEELKALQERVKKVVDQVSPSTVGLLVGSGTQSGAGSGVIVRDDGLILTAAHVIMDSGTGTPFKIIRVVLPDGTRVNAKPLGVNVKVDSGMVQITDKPPTSAKWPGAKDGKWPVAEVGSSSDLKKGQWVVALGHPGGPKLERTPPVRVGRYENYSVSDTSIQTDCTLVGGDSGGPLFDLNGKVVGIHSRIGFLLRSNMHVPTEAFRSDWDKLVGGTIIDPGAKAELGAIFDGDSEDATVKTVTAGGPAAKAGLKPGDVIVKFNKEQVHTSDDLAQLMSSCSPGDKVDLEVRRDGKPEKLTVTLGRKARKK